MSDSMTDATLLAQVGCQQANDDLPQPLPRLAFTPEELNWHTMATARRVLAGHADEAESCYILAEDITDDLLHPAADQQTTIRAGMPLSRALHREAQFSELGGPAMQQDPTVSELGRAILAYLSTAESRAGAARAAAHWMSYNLQADDTIALIAASGEALWVTCFASIGPAVAEQLGPMARGVGAEDDPVRPQYRAVARAAHRAGWSMRDIEKYLGVARKTVGKFLED